MHDPLHRLYRTKLALLAILLLFVGLGLLIAGHALPHVTGWQWLINWPIADIGSGMFTTGLLGVGLQYLDGADIGVSGSPSTFAATYDAAGNMAAETYPNGLIATRHFDNAGNLTSLTYAKSGSTWMSSAATLMHTTTQTTQSTVMT